MPLNIDKTLCMLSGSEHLLNSIDENEKVLNLYLNEKRLNQVSNCRYLGMQVDCHLKFNHHIDQLCKILSSKVAMLGRLRKTLNPMILERIYLTCIQPVFETLQSINPS